MKAKIRLCTFTFAVLLSVGMVYGAFEERGVGSGYLGRGGTGIAAGNMAFIAFRNAAALPFYAEQRLDLFYRNFYGLPDLNEVALAFTLPQKEVPLSFGLSQYGSKTYNETMIRVAAGYRVAPSLALGVTGNLYYVSLKNYGYSTSYGFGLSGLYTVTKRLNLGFTVTNLNEPTIGTAREKIPLTLIMGLSFSPIDDAILNVDVVKESGFDFDYRFGLEYVTLDWLTVRAGYRYLSQSISLGLGLFLGDFRADYSLEYHPELNYSHSVSVGYAF